MNKLTKLLSVFIIAGTMVGAGGALAACNKTPSHTHDYTYVSDGASGHHQECKDGDDTKGTVDHNFGDDNVCDDCGYTAVAVESVVLDKTEATVTVGGKETLTATVSPAGATNKTLTWTSSDESVATVNNGVVTAVAAGTATITVKSNNDKTATCEVTVTEAVVLTELVVSGKTNFVQNGTFDKTAIVVTAKYSDETEEDVSAKATFSTPDLTKLGHQTVTIEYGGKSVELKIYVSDPKWDGWTAITSVEEFNAFRSISTECSDKYYLTCDIDMTDVEVEGTKNMFSGTFDGDGYSIKNFAYKDGSSANKTGLLVRELHDGAVVQNVKFLNCHAQFTGETVGLIAGMSKGTVTVSQVEFNGCTVSCNNYAGLCIGRTSSTDSKVTLKEITAKNGIAITVVAYGGTLIGDINAGESAEKRAEVNIIDCDLDMKLTGSNANGGFLSGRIRNKTNLNIKNVVLRNAECPAQTGLVCGGGSNNAADSTVTVENLYIASTNANLLQSCAVADATNPVTTFAITYTNCYISGTAPSDTGSYLTEVDATAANVDWLDKTLKLDFTKEWTVEENNKDMYRLAASSSNALSENAVLKALKLSTANATVRFEKGTEFSAEGLSVTGIYTDAPIDDINMVLASGKFTVDKGTYDKDKAGKYTITVVAEENKEITATYEVEVVAQTSFTVDTQFAKLAYVVGDELDLSKLLVYGNWTDNKAILTKNYTTNADSLDMTTAGKKELHVSMTGFDDTVVVISVIDTKPYIVDGKVYINVNAAAEIEYAGAKVDGVETFKTINEAVEYLVSAKLDDEVVKVMYIADGTYTEKITIPASLKNLKMIGQSKEGTKLEYDAVEDTVDPINGGKYTMNCATLHVNAEGFGLDNITINNTFDYINDNTKYGNPQGFALTINGDGAVIHNVILYGNQDTLFFRHGRTYLKDTTIIGNIDFIFGENDGLAFFDNCTIKAITKSTTQQTNNGYVTAMKGDKTNHPTYGYIFSGCHFTDDGNLLEGSMSLGRPWGPGAAVAMINCDFSAAYSKKAYDGSAKSRWFDMSGNKPTEAYYFEYGSTGDGALVYTAKDEEENAEHKAGTAYEVAGMKLLTAETVADYTAANLFAATNGGVKWAAAFDYEGEYTKLASYVSKVTGTAIVVEKNGTVIETEIEVAEGDLVKLDVYMKEWNASNKNIVPTFEDATIATWNNGISGLKIGETKLTFTCGTVTKVITVKVIEATPFDVTFVTNGGTEVEAQKVFKDNKITAVSTTKENAIFRGWFTDAKFTTPFDPAEDAIVDNITLYARFVDYVDLAKENVTYSFNTTAGDGVYSFQYDGNNQKKGEGEAATFYGLNIWGAKCTERWKTSSGSNDDTQINLDTYISFAVERFATVKVTYRSNTNAELGIGEDIVTMEGAQDLTYFAIKAGKVVLKQTKNGYITGITVTYPDAVIDKTTKIDFGSEGNYENFKGLDQSKATYGQIQTACNQIPTGSILEFYVNPNATIHISGNWSVGYKINGTEVLSANAGGADDSTLNYDYFCKDGGKITIEGVHNNNYFYSISVSYPFMITENTKITFGSKGNAGGTIEGVTIGCTNGPNGEDNSQLKQGSIKINVKAGAKIHVEGNYYVDYTINGVAVKYTHADGEDPAPLKYDYTVTQDGEVEIVVDPDSTGKNYFYYIEVTFD